MIINYYKDITTNDRKCRQLVSRINVSIKTLLWKNTSLCWSQELIDKFTWTEFIALVHCFSVGIQSFTLTAHRTVVLVFDKTSPFIAFCIAVFSLNFTDFRKFFFRIQNYIDINKVYRKKSFDHKFEWQTSKSLFLRLIVFFHCGLHG